MTWRRATRIFLCCVPVVIGGYDFAAFWLAGDDVTVSRVVLGWLGPVTVQAAVALFALGALVGHLVIPQHPDPVRDKIPGRLQ